MQNNGKTTLVLTYNHIHNYKTGLYHGREGPVAVLTEYSARPVWSEQPNGKEEEGWDLATLDKTLRKLTPQVRLEEVGKAYIYAGVMATDLALTLAAQLRSAGKDPELVACTCRKEAKTAAARERGIPITWTDWCGGGRALEGLLDSLLGRIQGRNIQGLK